MKVMLFLFDIVEVRQRGDGLELSAGILLASFRMENFLDCPQCGCGLRLPLVLRRRLGEVEREVGVTCSLRFDLVLFIKWR